MTSALPQTATLNKVRTFCFFFSVQFLNYGLLCWNYRAVSQARYGSIFASDLMCAAVSFTLIKRVTEAKSIAAMAGYVLGGACGSLLSVWITRTVYGQ